MPWLMNIVMSHKQCYARPLSFERLGVLTCAMSLPISTLCCGLGGRAPFGHSVTTWQASLLVIRRRHVLLDSAAYAWIMLNPALRG